MNSSRSARRGRAQEHARPGALIARERLLQPVGERLACQLLRDVELEALAGVLHQLDRLPQPRGSRPRRRPRSSAAGRRLRTSSPAPQASARQVGEPQRHELQPQVQRTGLHAPPAAGSARSTRSRRACGPCGRSAPARPAQRLELDAAASPRARTARQQLDPRRLAPLAGDRRPREPLRRRAQRRPSSPASSRARSASCSASRTQASAVVGSPRAPRARPRPPPRSAPRTAPPDSASGSSAAPRRAGRSAG